jgi:lipoprotein signal peptidase
MNNIWKYSLVLAFSIIADQLVKGTAQSLISAEGGVVPLFSFLSFVRLRNENLIFGLKMPFLESYANGLAILTCSLLIFWCLKKIVINRNKSPLKGWAYTMLLTGLFTSWLDRISQGFTLDYLQVNFGSSLALPFSVGDIFFLCGVLSVMTLELKSRFN